MTHDASHDQQRDGRCDDFGEEQTLETHVLSMRSLVSQVPHPLVSWCWTPWTVAISTRKTIRCLVRGQRLLPWTSETPEIQIHQPVEWFMHSFHQLVLFWPMVNIDICIYVCICMYMYVYACICMYMYVCIYIYGQWWLLIRGWWFSCLFLQTIGRRIPSD